jgi:rubrerythrin
MTQIPNDPQKVAEAAMEYELEGRRILCESGEKATDPLSKSTFKFLADQELKHIEAIKSFAKCLSENEEFDVTKIDAVVDKLEARKAIKGIYAEFQPQFEDAACEEEPRLEVYKVAMDMEDHGHDFYAAAAEQATDSASRILYEFLAAEEINHFEIIQETHDFLAQPDAFQAIDEHWMTF